MQDRLVPFNQFDCCDPTIASMCPLCGSSELTTLIRQAPWSIRVCQTCTNAWTDPPPAPVNYQALDFSAAALGAEAEDPPRTVADLPHQWRQSVLMQADLLQRTVPQGGRILEIGCGEGILLAELQQRGFRVAGIEPGTASSHRAQRRGLEVVNDYFPSPAIAGPFDAVILSHVLEHFADPLPVLQQVVDLVPQGYALFVQTHYPGLVPRLYRRRWYGWFTHEHYWHFTPQGLNYLTQPLGLQPVTCEFSSLVHQDSPLVWSLSHLGHWNPLWYDQFHALFAAQDVGVGHG